LLVPELKRQGQLATAQAFYKRLLGVLPASDAAPTFEAVASGWELKND
jgi:hypothetical protein